MHLQPYTYSINPYIPIYKEIRDIFFLTYILKRYIIVENRENQSRFFTLGEQIMAKKVMFTDNDRKLVDNIKIYQQKHGFVSFASAVRKLCEEALRSKNMFK